MKNIILALTLLLIVKTASAQKDSLAIDDNNKYIYYQTVEQAGLNKDTLYTRALYFMKRAVTGNKLKLFKADEAQGVLTGNGSFMVTKKTLVLNGVGGEINYTMQIEVKDAKYRYWFTDFVFIPYQRDRYGMDVPTQGISIPLENAKSKIDPKDVAVYLDKILLNSRQVGTVLKSYVLKTSLLPKPKADKAIKKISTKEW